MKGILWLILAGGYGFLKRAAQKRENAKAALCFLDGGYLSFLCFALLPRSMGTEHFWGAAAAAAAGVLAATWLENRRGISVAVFAVVTGCHLLWEGGLSLREVLFLAFFGGMGLLHAVSGIILEKVEIKKALLSAAGFLFGTFLFVGF